MRCSRLFLSGVALLITAPSFADTHDTDALEAMLTAGHHFCAAPVKHKKLEADVCVDCQTQPGAKLPTDPEEIAGRAMAVIALKHEENPTGSPLLDYLTSAVDGDDPASTISTLQADTKSLKDTQEFAQGKRKAEWAAQLVRLKADTDATNEMSLAIQKQSVIKVALLKSLPDTAANRKELSQWREFPLYPIEAAAQTAQAEQKILEKGPQADDDWMKLFALEAKRLSFSTTYEKWSIDMNKVSLKADKAKLQARLAKEPPRPLTDDQLWQEYREVLAQKTMVGRGFASCGVTTPEHVALELYTEGSYLDINSALWKGDAGDYASQVLLINAALKKIKPYDSFVYRDANLPAASLAEHQVGKTVTYKGYTSTSIRGSFSPNRKVHIVIRSHTGRYITPFAQLWTESEVLFAPNSKFKITKRVDHADGSTDLEMEDVSAN